MSKLTLMVAYVDEMQQDCLGLHRVCCIDHLKDLIREFAAHDATHNYRLLELKLHEGLGGIALSSSLRKKELAAQDVAQKPL